MNEDLAVIDSAFESIKAVMRLKDTLIARLRSNNEKLAEQVSELTMANFDLTAVNHSLGKKLIDADMGSDVKFH